jgi:uncharacterized phosphosugar-binding protein
MLAHSTILYVHKEKQKEKWTMLKETFFQQLYGLIHKLEHEQGDNIDKAAGVIADAVASGNCIHVYDTGHMLDSELINRAGGLNGVKALKVQFSVDNAVRKRPEDKTKDRNLEGLMRYALKMSNLHPGDVLIVGSVSGKTVFPVDLALAAKEAGAYVIAITSIAYSSQLKSDHSSGKRLYEVADLVIDNGAPPLDAMVDVPELGLSICPASGISAAAIMWAVEAKVVEILLSRGIRPTVLKSVNYPGSAEHNEKEYQRYEETGY